MFKHFITILSVSFSLPSFAQQTVSSYDFYWKPCTLEQASFISTVDKTDSGWLRRDYFVSTGKLQMQALYKDSILKTQHGYTIYYYSNGVVAEIGKKVDAQREGVYINYHSNGMMSNSAFYHNNKPVGNRYMWHRNGYQSDSIAHVNDTTDVQVGWFDDGSPSHAGYLVNNKKAGIWRYYHRNGKLSAEENFVNGKLKTCTYYNEDGSLQPDSTAANADAVLLKGGEEGWKKYFEKNLYWPSGYQLVNTDAVVIGVQFVVNEDGTLSDVDTYIPFHPEFDKIALDALRKSPAWKPAIRQNRKVTQLMKQSVTFQQSEY